MNAYQHAYARASDDPEAFWREQAARPDWYRFPQQITAREPSGHYRWFPDGLLNTCH
jgi:propionyl-CoA synthetase